MQKKNATTSPEPTLLHFPVLGRVPALGVVPARAKWTRMRHFETQVGMGGWMTDVAEQRWYNFFQLTPFHNYKLLSNLNAEESDR